MALSTCILNKLTHDPIKVTQNDESLSSRLWGPCQWIFKFEAFFELILPSLNFGTMASLISLFELDHFTLSQTIESFKIGQALNESLSNPNFLVLEITSLVSQHYLAK